MTLTLGAKADDFNLPGVDGKNHSLEDLKDKKALILIFSCNHCPYVQAYEDRIIALQKDYADKGVQIVAINSNDAETYPEDNFENMKIRAKEKKFNFLYLRDDSQSLAKNIGATHTPQIFLFNQKRELQYTGKIDDNWKEPQKVTKAYLRQALEELLLGNKVKEPETFAIGCTIKWKTKCD